MNIVFLTTNEPIYLPLFYERVLREHADQTVAVYATPPLYKNQTTWGALKRYCRTFGIRGVYGLGLRVALAKLHNQSIESVCKKYNVAYKTTKDVNAPDFLDQLSKLRTDLIVSVSCPQIFKKRLIDLPKKGVLNVHGAILPHYRGVMPSFWMLANGEEQAGVTIHFVDEKIDAGDYVSQRVFEILPEDTLDSFVRRSKAIAADLLLEVLHKIEDRQEAATALNLEEGSYYGWPDREAVRRFRARGRKIW